MIALLVALGIVALISLHPWTEDSVAPKLELAPEPGPVALGDAVAVSPGRRLAVAPARSTGERVRFAGVGLSGAGGDSRPQLGLGPAQAVARSLPPGGVGQPPAPGAVPIAAQPAPAPAAIPVATTTPAAAEPLPASPPGGAVRGGGSPAGPIGAGGPTVGGPEAIEVQADEQRALSFSFYVQPSAFRAPGDENLIVRFKGEASELPTFGLQLWDDGGDQRGLWSSGEATDGERFLAAVEEGVWHQAVIFFQASSEGDGFYLLFLDGQPIEARGEVSLIDPGAGSTRIEVGLFRDDEPAVGSPDVLFGPVQVDESLESVIP